MKVVAVLGGQWGDEGKGKVVDLLANRFDVVARYHGGHNAGHTVKYGDRHFALHLLPAGVLRGRTGSHGQNKSEREEGGARHRFFHRLLKKGECE